MIPSPSTEVDNEADNEVEADDEAESDVEAKAEDEFDDEADILAEAEAMADILAEVEAESDGSSGYVMMDLEDDRLHGYATPILLGPNLFLRVSLYGSLVCPVWPNRKACGWSEADARAHVLARAHAP
jgi:hypothetical protein